MKYFYYNIMLKDIWPLTYEINPIFKNYILLFKWEK